jgi:F5/8 type C domain
MLLSGDLLAFDRLPAAELDRQVTLLENATEWMAGLVDPVSLRTLKATTVLRLLCAALAVVLPLAWVGAKIFAPKNYAFRKPATSSSAAYGTSPDGAVDGIQGAYGFHSAMEDMPWWAVDLTHPMTVTRIVVYGRGDCCYDQSIPLDLEVSDDGKTYRKIAARNDEFSSSNPWVVKPDSLVTRFIRLHVQRHAYLVFSEVEVNGRPPK